ncbi:MAG: site-specific DNA-methyltransferase [Treponemataceae bacterium]|nr:site-specific DNA-methyltransferase [Treponemataceae bacterium]
MKSLADRIFSCFRLQEAFSLKDVYSQFSNKPNETIRARIYENLGIKFQRIAKGIYKTIEGNESCIIIEGDGRDLSFLEDNSIDCIITDHPWSDKKSNRGGNRSFSDYECFQYDTNDFKEKARVLKDGCFLVEILPAENESNFRYLYQLKEYAEQNGLFYYSKVTWKKGNFVSNTGRKAKNSQDVMIFSKGKARNMRYDSKKSALMKSECYMSGTSKMLPTMFDVQPVQTNKKIHQSELPVSLCEQIIEYVTYEGEVILDTFAGSGVVGIAALNKKRNCILIEKESKSVEKILKRFSNNLFFENPSYSQNPRNEIS